MLEVHLVPKHQTAGYLWSYIWTIELTPEQTRELLEAISAELPSAALQPLVLGILENASKTDQPFGPGSLSDYDIETEKAAIRFSL